MGARVKGGDDLQVYMTNVAERSNEKIRRGMRHGAKMIKEGSIERVPVDEHNLEEAHHIVETRGARNRIEIAVEVSGQGVNRDVDDYAMRVHEAYPGDSNPGSRGEGTNRKQAAKPTVYVGGKYLERALDENEDKIMAEIEAAIRGAF